MLVLRNLWRFQPVINASGARNFDGSGWPYHQVVKPFGLDFTGSSFQAKTTTLLPKPGNMVLRADGKTPRDFLPDCIKVDLIQGHALNAVGLSGPGAEFLFDQPWWREQAQDFFISFMAIGKTAPERLAEVKEFTKLMLSYLNSGRYIRKPALAINFSCPNVGLDVKEHIEEWEEIINILSVLQIPLIAKFNALVHVSAVKRLAKSQSLDAICVSNTIPWLQCPERIDWKKLFGTTESPLAKYGGGGLSGAPLLPIVIDWIREARREGFSKPIIGCGGILSASDALAMLDAGANAVELGSVCFLRPHRVSSIIHTVHERLSK